MATAEGIEPPLTVLETVALPLYYAVILGLGCKNRTCASWSQTTNDTISPIRDKIGAGYRNRTDDHEF